MNTLRVISYDLRPPEHWDRAFESRWMFGYISAFFCVVLPMERTTTAKL